MSFNLKKIGDSYKINYSGGKFRPVNVNKLPNKTRLQGLDIVDMGQPFVDIVSKFQDTRGLDTVYNGQPFYGHTDAIAIPSSRISTTNHPDVNNWLNTVALNGGSASSSTIAALNTFCNSIDGAGLRSKFYRLNLFCGNNLNSCLVPLYNSPSANGIPLGFSIDSSTNFTTSDYTETGSSGGLLGNGTNSYLNTGIDASLLPISTSGIHMGTYIRSNTATAGSTKSTIGVISANSLQQYFFAIVAGTPSTISTGFSSFSANPTYPSLHLVSLFGTNVNGLLRIGSSSFTSSNTLTSNNVSSKENILVMARNSGGGSSPTWSNAQHWSGRVAGYTIGSHLTSSESLAFNSALETFQTSLNRNV